MAAEQKFLDVKILNSSNIRQAVEDLVQSFRDAGKITAINRGPDYVRYDAQCPMATADSLTDKDLTQLRKLGAAANIFDPKPV